jgi:UDP-N-acetylglucosamine diphosphorylase / glucose-1-phosphate thymidylyltransferase / UDP-N-acetylgalactosamine diphosphorylase / glucosamine-1-phosphate N-acetyltransferase / galactosamine-1-phosphate N-acetyltransferase
MTIVHGVDSNINRSSSDSTVVLFEDLQTESLAPITLARLAATITCGSLRLIDLIEPLKLDTFHIGRDHLQMLQVIDFPSLKLLRDAGNRQYETPKCLLNARLAPTQANLSELKQLLKLPTDKTIVVMDREWIAAVLNPSQTLASLLAMGRVGVLDWLASQATSENAIVSKEIVLQTFEAPHEVISTNMKSLSSNLEHRIASGTYKQLQDGVFVAEGTSLGQYVLFETGPGPIVIDQDAKVGPYSLMRGPLYVGPKCKILEHSAIKDNVSLGHTTKIGGEVEASVVEPYTNKQHHGFLGHSYLGSWINLGAGTCNSDLKNTYGTVNMEYPHGKSTTGMQFLGCVMGDYSKTAINTGIFTGKVIGVCSMMYGFVTGNVPSFVNYARLFGQVAPLPAEVMVATQQRMFSRRNVTQRPCDIQLIHDMYRITQFERQNVADLM